MRAFIPSKKNRFIFWFCNVFFVWITKKMDNLDDVILSSDDLSLLKSLKDKRILIFSNHPTHTEPKLTFYLGKLIGSPLNFMASRIIFTWVYGLFGFVIRRAGAYSIIPASNDILSFQYSIKILSEKAGKLVIFPEGTPVSKENITLMPFQSGFSFLSMLTMDKIRKKDTNGDILVLPVCYFYVCNASVDAMKQNVDKRLQWLEQHYGVEVDTSINILDRILNLNIVTLEKYEKKYEIIPKKNEGVKSRWGTLRHHILNKLAVGYKIKNYDEKENAILKLRRIDGIAELYKMNYSVDKLHKVSKKEQKQNDINLTNIKYILTLDDQHLKRNPSYEKCFEWIDRFEQMTNQKKKQLPALPRKAHIKIGNTFHISEYYSKERSKRKELMESITNRVRKELGDLLSEMEPLSHQL